MEGTQREPHLACPQDHRGSRLTEMGSLSVVETPRERVCCWPNGEEEGANSRLFILACHGSFLSQG